MNKITVIIYTQKNDKNIKECFESAKLLTDNIIFVYPDSNYVETVREKGIRMTKTQWVLILDVDERITKELALEIKEIINSHHKSTKNNQLPTTHYKIPRKNIFGKIKWLKHGGWWPDYQIRLINKKYFVSWPKRIHSTPIINGKIGYLKNPLLHLFHADLESMVKKTLVFEDIESDLMYQAKTPVNTLIFFRKFIAELWRRMFKNLGFLDGVYGIIESIYQAFSKTITYLFLYEKNLKGTVSKRSLPKNIKVGLYNPYLDVLGGGEKHILSIIDVFAEIGGEITIFWNKDLSQEIKNRFSIHYINKIKWFPSLTALGTLKTLRILKTFDYFFYVTDGSYFFSTAKKNFVFCMVPDKKLYNLNLLNRLKLWNYKFISNSPYTTKWLTKWGLNPITIPPYIEDKLFTNNKSKKEKIILSVGRFFSHLHKKNQEEIIETFKLLKLSNSLFKNYKLVLAGGLKEEDKKYFDKLKLIAKNDSSIIFKPNISLDELYKLYQLSTYFWHFTGLKVDEEKHPEKVEHFGIAPLEAMASGCITFCHNSGNPKEIIKDLETGILFNNEKDLLQKMDMLEKNDILRIKIIKNGQKFVKNNYNYQVFKKKIFESIL